jgi:hypothetical protein
VEDAGQVALTDRLPELEVQPLVLIDNPAQAPGNTRVQGLDPVRLFWLEVELVCKGG